MATDLETLRENLFTACAENNIDITTQLIEQIKASGAALWEPESDQLDNPLVACIKSNIVEIAKLLINSNPHLKINGKPALYYAAHSKFNSKKSPEIIKHILAKADDPLAMMAQSQSWNCSKFKFSSCLVYDPLMEVAMDYLRDNSPKGIKLLKNLASYPYSRELQDKAIYELTNYYIINGDKQKAINCAIQINDKEKYRDLLFTTARFYFNVKITDGFSPLVLFALQSSKDRHKEALKTLEQARQGVTIRFS